MVMLSSAAEAVIERFTELSAISRPSRREERVMAWLRAWADARGFEHAGDATGNLCVRVPARGASGDVPAVVLQGHVDMVCEKTPGSTHDFECDPIRPVRDGEWLRATDTTLGADNGIAVALMMTLAETPGLTHPPLELLFTIDEETGLTGALGLDPALIRGRRLINLDSEEEGVIIVGCAGGATTFGALPVEHNGAEGEALRIAVGGLQGGHSGIDIHLGRGNAIKVMARLLRSAGAAVRLADLRAGRATNAIPRDAEAVVVIDPARRDAAIASMREAFTAVKSELQTGDPGVTWNVEAVPAVASALSASSTAAVLDALLGLPHGVQRFDAGQPDLVETSCNLARVELQADRLELAISLRSIRMERLAELRVEVRRRLEAAGAQVRHAEGYPSWAPDFRSPLLARVRAAYEREFGSSPRVEVIHAGLECGVIGSKVAGMEML